MSDVLRFAWLLRDELASLPMRADGALNHGDFYHALTVATTRLMDGEGPTPEPAPQAIPPSSPPTP